MIEAKLDRRAGTLTVNGLTYSLALLAADGFVTKPGCWARIERDPKGTLTIEEATTGQISAPSNYDTLYRAQGQAARVNAIIRNRR